MILAGTVALMLPFSSQGSHFTPFLPAFFTATSAVSLTGLIVVDTATYWTPIGQSIIISLIQLGGLGIMTLASLSGLLITGRISMKTRQLVAAEGRQYPQDAGFHVPVYCRCGARDRAHHRHALDPQL